MNDIRAGSCAVIPESKVYLSTPPVIPGLGASGGFEMVLEARGNASYNDLQRAVDTLMHYASKRKELTGLSSSMQSDIPQLYFDVDRDKAQMLGRPDGRHLLDGEDLHRIGLRQRLQHVQPHLPRLYPGRSTIPSATENLGLFFVRGADKAMIPITALGTTSYTTGPGTIRRFNMFNSATISGEGGAGLQFGTGDGPQANRSHAATCRRRSASSGADFPIRRSTSADRRATFWGWPSSSSSCSWRRSTRAG